MILVITHKNDFTADFVINKLNERDIPYRRFNCEDILNYDWTLSFNPKFKFDILSQSEFSSIWFRRTKLPDLTDLPVYDRHYILNEVDSFISNLFQCLSAKWISHPSSVYQAENKLLQLRIANDSGFLIPQTIITNSKQELLSFYHKHNEEIIIKPLSQTRLEYGNNTSFIFTNKVSKEQLLQLDNFDLTPSIFQKYVPKDREVRVTVIGEKVFAASVNSQDNPETLVDWRRKRLPFHIYALPEHVSQKCITLVKKLNLVFGAIDLIKGKDGQYYFLEVNPNGQWAWIENDTGLDISSAIVEELIKNKL